MLCYFTLSTKYAVRGYFLAPFASDAKMSQLLNWMTCSLVSVLDLPVLVKISALEKLHRSNEIRIGVSVIRKNVHCSLFTGKSCKLIYTRDYPAGENTDLMGELLRELCQSAYFAG